MDDGFGFEKFVFVFGLLGELGDLGG